MKSTSGLSIKKKAELIRKINKSKSLNELFTVIRRENIDFKMFNQPVLTGITQIISELKPIESEKDVPFENVKKKAREAILASSEDFQKNGTVGENEEKVIREINKCKSISELFSIIGRENIDLENFSQYKSTSVTPGVLEIKQIKNKRELPFERIKEIAISSVLAVEDDNENSKNDTETITDKELIEEVIDAVVEEVMEEIKSGQVPEELIEVVFNENTEQVNAEIPQDIPKSSENVEVTTKKNSAQNPVQKTVSINIETNNMETNDVHNDENNLKPPTEIPLEDIRERVRQVFVEQVKGENTDSCVVQGEEIVDEMIEVFDNCNTLGQLFQTIEQNNIEINMKSHSDASCVSRRKLAKKKTEEKNDTPVKRLKQKVIDAAVKPKNG